MRTDKERLATIETEIGHLKASIEELYRYLREEFSLIVSKQTDDLRARLKEHEDRHDGLASKEALSKALDRIEDLERRLRTLERKGWQAIGALAFLGFALPIALKLLKVY